MAEAKWADLGITFDNAAGAPIDIKAMVEEFNGIEIEAIIAEATHAGDAWVRNRFEGLSKVNDMSLGGAYTDDVAGTDAMFKGIGSTRTLAVTWRGTKVTTVEVIIKKYGRKTKKGTTMFEVSLVHAGEAPIEV